MRLGYATTVHKVQGRALGHVTVSLDAPNCNAAGYVALARFRRDRDYLIGCRPTVAHFTPAR